ncbi:MAG: ABC transporter ATP-binding protein [Magnetovibrio sp.]|nr:ABC transporter ATP-binding protein [Magnetovibrio sp.]
MLESLMQPNLVFVFSSRSFPGDVVGMSDVQIPLVEVSNLRFRWLRKGTDILSIENLTVQKGERLFVKGNSGSGKTTLLNIIAGIITPQNGSVKILDETISSMSSWKRDGFRAQHIGIVFQIFNLIPYLSLVDNVILPCHFSAPRRKRALERSSTLIEEASRLLEHLGLDINNLADQPVSRLSVGQQQRVAVARALMGGPELVIADEPTSALDANARSAFLKLLFREVEDSNASLIFVSHDASLEPYFERSIHLDKINHTGPRAT